MPDQASIVINDFDGQQGVLGVNSEILTAANFVAQLAELEDLKDALAPIALGLVISTGISHRIQWQNSNAKATSPLAQRGNKWKITASDSTVELAAGVPNPYFMKPFFYEVPTAKLSLREDNNNIVYVKDGTGNIAEFDTFVPFFEGFAKSPVGGTLDVLQVEAVTSSGG